MLAFIRSRGEIALCCALSGVPAAHPGGRTAHKLFKIDVQLESTQEPQKIQCNVSPASQRATLLRQAKLIIWDESVMSHRGNFEAVNEMLQNIRSNSEEPCGGVVFIGAGDFRQIPPVIVNGCKDDIIDASIKSSKLWKSFEQYSLTAPMRQAGDLAYAKYAIHIQTTQYTI